MAAKSKAKSTEKSKFKPKVFGRTGRNKIPQTGYHAVSQRRPWLPGARRTPWMAFAAIVLTLAAVATSIGILVGSDGKPVNSWTFQPTVYLAIATTIANICLHFAFSQGVTIAWWRRALRGTTIEELHHAYDFGNNFWAAIFAFRYVNFIALTCLMVTVSPINGPLMQRASQISTASSPSTSKTLRVPVAAEIPGGFTAYVSTREQYVSMLQRNFIPTVSEWNAQSPIQMKNTCSGTCTGRLRGAGFSVNCSRSTLSFDLDVHLPSPLPDDWEKYMRGSQYFGITAGGSIYGEPINSGSISVVYKNTTACKGQLQVQNCTLQPGTVSYPVRVNGNQQSISLEPGTTIWDDEIVSITSAVNESMSGARTRFGGIYKALADRYTSSASMSTDPVYVEFFSSAGFYANPYALIGPNDTSPVQNCSLSYANPLPDLLQSARDLMFRTAIRAAPYSYNLTTNVLSHDPSALAASTQIITVSQSSAEPRYKSQYAWLAGALLATFVPTLSVLVMFWGYWRIGRPVSLSPVETAKALGSPLLVSKDGNARVKDIVKELGGKKVRYGGVVRDESGSASSGTGEVGGDGDREGQGSSDNGVKMARDGEVPMLRLQMKSPELVLAPLKGWIFAG